ncbi:MAG: SMU1112c/YaeR family gloxylase I-like metalloprotein [Culicoidibacterales bacterium]
MYLQAIHHVAIIASDYQKSKHFYTVILQLPILHEVYREERQSFKLDLQLGTSQLELFSFPCPPKRPTTPEARGLRHLAFSVDDIEATIDYLQTHGIICEPVRIDEYTQRKFTFFQDPDGLPLELYEQ